MPPRDPSKIPPGIRPAVELPPNTARLARELDDEVRFHIEQRVTDLVARGMSEARAREEALRKFGDVQDLQQYVQSIEVPQMRRTQLREWLAAWTTEGFWTDVRFAARSLMRSRSFAIAAVLALGLGTGSAAGVFSMVEGVVLRPLPYKRPEQLVTLWEGNGAKNLERQGVSPVNFMDYRALRGDFDDVAAWWRPVLNLSDDATGEPIRVNGVETSQNLLRMLGVSPMIGRGFSSDSTLAGTVPEVLISHRLWQSRFNGDRAIVGKMLRLNGQPWTVIGVMTPGFAATGETDVWQGLQWDYAQHSRGAHFLEVIARLKPGLPARQVNADLSALGARLGDQFRTTNQGWAARVVPLDREVAGIFRPALFALLGAAGLLLLIACINVANLLLARATARKREVALRAAIGATRPRLVRLFLTESLVLAVVGSAFGLLVAVASVKGLLAWSPIAIPRAQDVRVDGAVLVFATLIAVITTIAFGLAPALFLSRADLQDALKEGAKGVSARARGTRRGLVIAQLALATVLLSGGGLLVRSVAHMLGENAGVDPRSVITADLQLSGAAYANWARVDQFYSSVASALRERPEVIAAGTAEFLPLAVGWRLPVTVVGAAPVASGDEPIVQFHAADEGYFAALRIPLLRGRSFDAHDDSASVPVVVINAALAKQLWPGEDAIGKRIATTVRNIGPLGVRLSRGNEHEVIGVVGDVKNSSLKNAAEPALYFSQHQFPFRKMHVVVRGRGEPTQLAALMRDAVRRLDPALPVADVKTMERVLSETVDPPRFVMLLLALFAILALALAAVGVYGILTYTVNQRRREIGIRLALGASPAGMLRMVVREGIVLALAGAAIGLAGTYAASRALTGFLYRVSPWDPITLGAVIGLVLVVSTLACLVPGRRASAEDPAGTLRAD